jgi:RNA polymerase sigma factor (sigma-70 family)
MPVTQSYEALLLEQLPLIERIIGSVCRRHSLRAADADDFGAWVKLRLIEDDYGILRRFRGESGIGTYLTVVIASLFRDHRMRAWGKWRPSAEAKRRGPLALRLEALVYRQGHSLEQAAELLRTTGETTQSDREIGTLLAALPARLPARPVDAGAAVLDGIETTETADARLLAEAADRQRATAEAAIDAALEQLEPEDRLLVRMRFWNDLGVAEIARAVGQPQKPLYRRLDTLLRELRRSLLSRGVGEEQLRELIGDP